MHSVDPTREASSDLQAPHPPHPPTERNGGAIASAVAGPTRPGERLLVMDVLRGIALFGIFVVNMPLMAMPMMIGFGGPAPGNVGDDVAWWISTLFFQFKFISLYSILFGAGFMLQRLRAEAKGRSHTGVYVRRLLVLSLFGLIHAILIWYGDILFMYSMLGFLLLGLGSLSAKTLVRIGIAGVLIGAVLSSGFGALQIAMTGGAEFYASSSAVEQADEVERDGLMIDGDSSSDAGDVMLGSDSDPESDGDFDGDVVADEMPLRGIAAMTAGQFNPFTEEWIEGETAAFRDGPVSDAILFRAVLWGFGLISGAFSWGWHVAGLFLVGAAMMKGGFFAPERAAWHRRAALLLIPGLLLQFANAWVLAMNDHNMTMGGALMSGPYAVGAVMTTFGYIGVICLVVHRRPDNPMLAAIAKPGRMGLTGYLGESVIATGIMYWWGLAMFGTFDRLQLIGLVVVIYLAILAFANIWFRFFMLGPLEWVWRSATYLRAVPLRSPLSHRV